MFDKMLPPPDDSRIRAKAINDFLDDILAAMVDNAPDEERCIYELPLLVRKSMEAIHLLIEPERIKTMDKSEMMQYSAKVCPILERVLCEIENLKGE